jgi:glycosyltransferase involved in cell wall biosynthesis
LKAGERENRNPANHTPQPPVVSVVVPCYNQAQFLPEALGSIQAQTHSGWECIVIDDGSTDETAIVADSLAVQDQRIKVVRQPHRGPSGARNLGLRLASGRYIQFLDADDVIEPDKLEAQLSALSTVQELALSYADYRYCPEHDVAATTTRDDFPPPRFITGRPLWDIASRWETEFSIPIHCFLFDARFFTERGILFDETLPNHVDWDCWMQIFALDPRVILVPGPLAIYRLHAASLTSDRAAMGRGFAMALEKQLGRFRDDPETYDRLLRKQAQMRSLYDPSIVDVLGRKLRHRLKSWRRP